MDKKVYPEGQIMSQWMGIMMAVVTAIVTVICILVDTPEYIGLGPAMGISIGIAIGVGIESKLKKEGRIIPQTAEMKKRSRRLLLIGVLVLLALVGATILVFLL